MITRWICLYAALLLTTLNIHAIAQHEGHNMPSAPSAAPSPSPSPGPSPAAMPRMPGHTQAPAATSSPSPTPSSIPQTMPGMAGHPHASGNAMGAMANNSTDLMVMKDDDMFIRVGASENNLLPMGGMGSGTSWQPASTQMNMLHKQSGDWLLMFHYNFVGGVN